MKNKLMVVMLSLSISSTSLIDASAARIFIKKLAKETKLSDFKHVGYATVGTGSIVGLIEYYKRTSTAQQARESQVDQLKQSSNKAFNSVQSTVQAHPYATGAVLCAGVGSLGYIVYKKYFSKKS